MFNLLTSNSLLVFDPSYISLGLNIAFGVFIASLLLAGIIGMVRGVFNATWRLLFTILLIVLAVFLTRPIADTIANMNLSKFLNFSFDVPINGSNPQDLVTIQFTSLKETIENAFIAFSGNNPHDFVNYLTKNAEILAFAQEMTMVVLRFVTFIILTILICTIGNFLETILYHCAVKFLIPKKVRKKVKLRILAFFEGVVKQGLIMALMMMPFTALVNSVKKGVAKYEAKGLKLTDGLLNDILTYIDAYDDSIIGQILFGYTDANGNSLDMIIMDYIVSGELSNGDDLVFSDQMSSLAEVGAFLLDNGVFGTDSFDVAALLTEDMISYLLGVLEESSFFCTLLSVMLSVGEEYAKAEGIIDSTVDLSSVNIHNELQVINEIFGALSELDMISGLFEEPIYINLPFDDDDVEIVHNAFAALDNSEILREVVPGLLYKLITDKTPEGDDNPIGKYINADLAKFKTIRWGQELTILYDSLFQVNKIIPLKDLLETTNKTPEPIKINTLNGFTDGKKTEDTEEKDSDLIANILENIGQLKAAFVGQFNASGEPISSDIYCFLDSELVTMSLDKLLPEILRTALISAYIDFDNIINVDEIVDIIDQQLSTRNAIKKELSVIIDVVAIFSEDSDMFTGNILESIEARDALRRMAPNLDKSLILSKIMPAVLESLAQDMDFGDDLPITGSDLNFYNISFGTEIPLLLDTYELIDSLQNVLNSASTGDLLNDLNPTDLRTLLENFYNSQILNPVTDIGGTQFYNVNFYKIIDYIFDNENLKDIHLSSKVDYDDLTWLGEDGEIAALANVFATIKNQDLVDLLTYSGNDVLSQVDGSSIEELLLAVDKSQLISATFGDVLDNLFGSVIPGVSFNNITDWGTEAANFGIIIDTLKTFDESIDQIDWLNSDPENVRTLLKALARSSLFTDELGNTTFGEFLSDKLTTTALGDYLKDYPSDPANPTYMTSHNDCSGVNKVNKWTDEDGEADAIADIIKEIQGLAKDQDPNNELKGTDGLDTLSNGDISATQLEKLLLTINTSTSLRMIIVNAFDTSLEKLIALDEIDMDKANIRWLLGKTNEEREPELQTIIDVYKDYETMFGVGNSSSVSIEIKDVDATILESLMTNIHNSQIFNTLADDSITPRIELTVFEQMISYVFDQADLSLKIADSGKTTINNRIIAISEESFGPNDGWLSYDIGDVTYSGEIANIGNLVRSVQAFGTNDITTIDWLNEDTVLIKDLFTSLAELRLLIDRDYDDNEHTILGRVIFNTLLDSNDTTLKEKLCDYETESNPTYNEARKDFNSLDKIADWTAPNGEIDAMVGVIEALQIIDNPTGGGSGQAGLDKINAGDFDADDLEEILGAMNESISLRMVVVNTMDNAIRKSVSIDQIDTDYCNFVALTDMLNDERAEEFKQIVKLVRNMDIVAPKDPVTKNRDMSINNVDLANFNLVLEAAHDSIIINSIDEYKYGSNHTSLTVFEQIVSSLFEKSNLKDKILLNGETSLDGRIIAISEESFGNGDGWITYADNGVTHQGEIDNICDLLLSIQAFKVSDVTTIDWLNEDTQLINDLFRNLAKLRLLFDRDKGDGYSIMGHLTFETMMDSEFKDKLCDYGTSTGTMTFITARADFESLEKTDDWIEEDGEIDAITRVIDALQSLDDQQNNSGSAGLQKIKDGNFMAADLDLILSKLNDSTSLRMVVVNTMDEALKSGAMVDGINLDDCNIELLVGMDKSQRGDEFKQIVTMIEMLDGFAPKDSTGARTIDVNNVDADELQIFLEASYESVIFNTFQENAGRPSITPFEQIMRKLVVETTIDQKYPQNGVSIDERISDIGNSVADNQITSADDGWNKDKQHRDGEIYRIVDLVKAFQDSGITAIDEHGDSLLTIQPSQFTKLLHAINDSALLSDALPSLMDDIIEQSGMKNGNRTFNTNLTRSQFTEEIDVLGVFYENMRVVEVNPITQEETSRIFSPGNSGDDIMEYVKPEISGGMGRSTYGFIYFLSNSYMLEDARDDLLAQLIIDAGFGEFIRNLDINGNPAQAESVDFNKINTINGIFAHVNFDANVESYALDKILLELEPINSVLSDALVTNGDAIEGVRSCSEGIENLMRHTLNGGYDETTDRPGTKGDYQYTDDLKRAYLSSELIASVLTKYIDHNYYSPTDIIDWYGQHSLTSFDYEIMVHEEAEGLRGVLDALAAFATLDTAAIRASFARMGYIVDADHPYGNSHVAKSLFKGLVVDLLPATLDFTIIMFLNSIDPYSPGFVFEKTGNDIADLIDRI